MNSNPKNFVKSFDVEYLKTILTYDPVTGFWIWNWNDSYSYAWNKKCAGKRAGSIDKNGYRVIMITTKDRHKPYRSARLAWLYMTGEWPEFEIDHIDSNAPGNDSWDNLRLAVSNGNKHNTRKSKNNRCGYKGVTFHPQTGKYRARVMGNGIYLSLGLYSTAYLAHKAYCKKAKELHGEFFNPG